MRAAMSSMAAVGSPRATGSERVLTQHDEPQNDEDGGHDVEKNAQVSSNVFHAAQIQG